VLQTLSGIFHVDQEHFLQVRAYLHASNAPPVRTHRNPECLPAQAALLENLFHKLVIFFN